jgi:hypothetical protein
VSRRRNWGEDRVYYHDERGELGSLPTGWTDAADVDPFIVMSDGLCRARTVRTWCELGLRRGRAGCGSWLFGCST